MNINSEISRAALQNVQNENIETVDLASSLPQEQQLPANEVFNHLFKCYEGSELLQPIAEWVNQTHPEFDPGQKVFAVFQRVFRYYSEAHNERLAKILEENRENLLSEPVLSKLLSEYEDEAWRQSYGFEPRTEDLLPRKKS